MSLRSPIARGFTLIEIIVVVLVFSVMAAMAYGGLNSVLKIRRGVEDSMQRTAELQRAYTRLRQDFQNARDRPARNQYGQVDSPFMARRDEPVMLIRGGLRNPFGGSRPSFERVRYRVKDKALLRASWTAVDLPDKAEPTELTLLKGVEEVRWRFMDAGHEWQGEWPANALASSSETATPEPPPIAIELTLVTKDWGEMRFVFRTPQASLSTGGSGGASTVGGTSGSNVLTKAGLLPASALGVGGGAPDPTPDPGTDTPTPPDPPPDSDPAVPPDVPEDPGIPSGDTQ